MKHSSAAAVQRAWLRSGMPVLAVLLAAAMAGARAAVPAYPGIGHVFVVVMENHDWDTIAGSANCPYINKQLLPRSSYATRYATYPGIHPSEPNYLWLVAGTNFGILDDHSPATNTRRTTNHLAALLDAARLPWKAYAEDIPGDTVPVANAGQYAVRHVPFLFFENINTNRAYATNHVRPFDEFAGDLAAGRVGAFNFIVPNLTNDMHNLAPGSPSTRLQGDRWLERNLPGLLASDVFRRDGLLVLTWDEGSEDAAGLSSDGPVGCIVVSPRARGGGYHDAVPYTHGDTLRTVQDALGLRPYLGDAANSAGLLGLFDRFAIDGFGPVAGGFEVRVAQTVPEHSYALDACDDPVAGTWSRVATARGAAGIVALRDPSPPDAVRFYRVTRVP